MTEKSENVSEQDCKFSEIKYQDVEDSEAGKLLANQDEVSLEFLVDDKIVRVLTFDNGYFAWCCAENWKNNRTVKSVNYNYRILKSDKTQ